MRSTVHPVLVSIVSALLIQISAATAQPAAEVKFSTLPQWIESRDLPALDSTAKRGKQGSVRYLVVDRQVRTTPANEVNYQHIAYQLVDTAGMDEAAEIQISFNPHYETLHLHRLQLLRGNKVVDQRRREQIKLLQRETDLEKKIYDGRVTAVIILSDLRVGDVIDYAYSIEGRNPVFGQQHFSQHTLGWAVPVDEVSVRILSPVDRPLHSKVHNLELEVQTRRLGQMMEYRWTRKNVPAVIDEGEYPNWYQPYPWVQVSEYQDWRAVSDWASALYAQNGELSPVLKNKIQQIRASTPDPKQRITEALKFVQQDIRYFGVEIGQNSHRPSHPNDVVSKRYGDCKDKTVLLKSMLHELGIDAYPALVSTQLHRGIADWQASPGAFDHVILMAEVNGKRYWLDGTRRYQFGSLETLGQPNFGKALLVGHRDKHLVDIQAPDSARSRIEIEERYHILSYDKPVELEIISRYHGRQAERMRERFASNDHGEISRQYLNYYARRYPDIESAAKLTYSDDTRGNAFTTVERYRLGDFLDNQDGQFHFNVNDTTVKSYIALPKTIRRHSPLALAHPISVTHKISIRYPDDLRYNADPESTRIEDNVVRFEQQVEYPDNEIRIVNHYASKRDAVPVDEVARHIKQLRKINDRLYYSGWFASQRYTLEQARRRTDTKLDSLLERLKD